MPLTNYTDVETLKLHVAGSAAHVSTGYNAPLSSIVEAASRAIDMRCGRYFGVVDPATTRKVKAHCGMLIVDDISDTAGVIVEDEYGNAVTDYDTYPLNGVVGGSPGHPVTRIVHDSFVRDQIYEVTAKWGWPEVPPVISEACLLVAADMFFAKDTPHGIKGMPDFGITRIRENRQIDGLLNMYTREVAIW